MLARAQTPHIVVHKSLIAVLLLNAPSDLFQSLYLLLSKALLALFFSKPRAKIRLFMRVGVEKLTKKQHNFLSSKKLCCLIVPYRCYSFYRRYRCYSFYRRYSFYRCYSSYSFYGIYFPFSLFKTPLRRCIPLASGSNRSACALG